MQVLRRVLHLSNTGVAFVHAVIGQFLATRCSRESLVRCAKCAVCLLLNSAVRRSLRNWYYNANSNFGKYVL